MARKKYSIDSRIDYSVILPVFFLLLIGLVAIYIATINDYPSTIAKVMTQQVIWILLGAVWRSLSCCLAPNFYGK